MKVSGGVGEELIVISKYHVPFFFITADICCSQIEFVSILQLPKTKG